MSKVSNDNSSTTDNSSTLVEARAGEVVAGKGVAFEHDAGLSDNLQNQIDTPQSFLERTLIDDEFVVETFDVKFPGQFVPVWKIVSLLIVTVGLYGFVLCFRAIQRWCYRHQCCKPTTVSFTYGKMAITSRGRVICWKEDVYQHKPPQKNYGGTILLCYLDYCFSLLLWCISKCCIWLCCPDLCAPKLIFNYNNESRSYRIADVKQVTQFMTSQAHCLFCCIDYEAGIEISFNAFNSREDGNHLTVATKSWFSKDTFGKEADTAAGSSSNIAYYSWARSVYAASASAVSAIEGATGVSHNLNTLFVFSNTGDRVHNGDIDGILKDLNKLHKRILQLLPTPRTAILKEPVDPKKIVLSGYDPSHAGSVYTLTDKFKNVTIVGNGLEVAIPADWMPLMDGEEVIATTGLVFRMRCIEWFLSIITCGAMYILKYRRRKYTRSALVLTNTRLISFDIFERSGTVPLSLTNFSVQVRSYILGDITSGFISSQGKKDLAAGIECDGGALFINFYGQFRNAYPFAQAMQMTARRAESMLSEDCSSIGLDLSKEKRLNSTLIPIMTSHGEIPLNMVLGTQDWEPFGSGYFAKLCTCLRRNIGLGMCCRRPVDNCCSREACNKECCCENQDITPFFFPCIPYILTCALRPFQSEATIIITNTSLIRVATVGNYGLCGCLRLLGFMKQGFCTKNDSFIISWQTVDSFSGFNVRIMGAGAENVLRRLCRSNCCGRVCCPIGFNRADIDIDFKGNYSFSTTSEEANAVWIKDEGLNSSIKTLTRLQFAVQNDTLVKAKKEASPAIPVAKVSGFLSGSAPPVVYASIVDLEKGL